jgi:hypothetical protein
MTALQKGLQRIAFLVRYSLLPQQCAGSKNGCLHTAVEGIPGLKPTGTFNWVCSSAVRRQRYYKPQNCSISVTVGFSPMHLGTINDP